MERGAHFVLNDGKVQEVGNGRHEIAQIAKAGVVEVAA